MMRWRSMAWAWLCFLVVACSGTPPHPAADLGVDGALADLGADRSLADQLAGAEEFRIPAQLPPAVQERLQTVLARLADEPAVRDVLHALVASPGFLELTVDEQLRLISLTGALNPVLGVPAQKVISALLGSSGFLGATPSSQAEQLRTMLDQEAWLRFLVEVPLTLYQGRAVQHSVSEPVEVAAHKFNVEDKVLPAWKYDVALAYGRTVAVYQAQGMDATALQDCPTIPEYALAIATLPPLYTKVFFALTIFSQQLSIGGFMGVDGWNEVWAQPLGKGEQAHLNQAIAHEVGHLLSVNVWGFSSWYDDAPEWAPWKAAMAEDQLHVSQYAMTLVADDVAETFSLFAAFSGTPFEVELREIIPARMALVDQLLATLE